VEESGGRQESIRFCGIRPPLEASSSLGGMTDASFGVENWSVRKGYALAARNDSVRPPLFFLCSWTGPRDERLSQARGAGNLTLPQHHNLPNRQFVFLVNPVKCFILIISIVASCLFSFPTFSAFLGIRPVGFECYMSGLCAYLSRG
jgi:hypothetical protein